MTVSAVSSAPRCTRFCDEVTGTSELGVFNRGDKSVIGIHPERELDNPFSGCVSDLCPVGALTHRRWRFNTRIWYTDRVDSLCVGCSTGCNAEVAVRDGQVTTVKGRCNSEVNQEWLCDEGRYNFARFQPQRRLESLLKRDGDYLLPHSREAVVDEAAEGLKRSAEASTTAVFLSPFLTLEEIWTALEFCEKVLKLQPQSPSISMQIKQRELSELEKILISPDYAPNARAMSLFGFAAEASDEETWRDLLERRYRNLLSQLRSGQVSKVLIIGDEAIAAEDVDDRLSKALLEAEVSVSFATADVLSGEDSEDARAISATQLCHLIVPIPSVYEKDGIMVNESLRLQRLRKLFQPPQSIESVWAMLVDIAGKAGVKLGAAGSVDERSLFRAMTKKLDILGSISLNGIGEWGISIADLRSRLEAASRTSEESDTGSAETNSV